MNSQSVLVRVASTVVAVLVALWIANALGAGLCLQIVIAVGKSVAGLFAGIFGMGK